MALVSVSYLIALCVCVPLVIPLLFFFLGMFFAGLAVSQAGWWSLILLNLQNGLLILILHFTEYCSMQFPSVHAEEKMALRSNNAVNLKPSLQNCHLLLIENQSPDIQQPFKWKSNSHLNSEILFDCFKVPLPAWRLFSFTHSLPFTVFYLPDTFNTISLQSDLSCWTIGKKNLFSKQILSQCALDRLLFAFSCAFWHSVHFTWSKDLFKRKHIQY